MEHQFNVQVAQQFGIEEAVVIHNLFHWISKNAANEQNEFDGLYWTYNSIKAYSLLFPYMSEAKIKRIFKTLEEKQVIIKSRFNEDKWDKTNWYSFPIESLFYLSSVGYNVHWLKMNNSISSICTNREEQNEPMILINNTNSKPNSKQEEKDSKEKEIKEFVERIYKMYPSKCPVRNTYLGKSMKDKQRIRSLLKTYSMEDIERVVNKEIETKYGKFRMQNLSTFLNNFPDPNEMFGSEAHRRDLEGISVSDIPNSFDGYVWWMNRNTPDLCDRLRGGWPQNESEYFRMIDHTEGGKDVFFRVLMLFYRDGWSDFYDERGFMFTYANYIKANGLYKD